MMAHQRETQGIPGLTRWSMQHPRLVFALVLAGVAIACLALFRLKVDTDPENMLPADEPVRVLHRQAKARFDLHDAIVVGVVPDNAEGIYNPRTLEHLAALSAKIQTLDHVVSKDVLSLATVDNVESDAVGEVRFSWLMKEAPRSQQAAAALRKSVERLPLFVDSLVSKDGRAAAIFVPVDHKDESQKVAEAIRAIVAAYPSSDGYHIAGLPVAEDTFGVEMFVQMAISAPLAALVIVLMLWMFFRSGGLIVSPMLIAMASVIITMGMLIGSGYSVHIMSSMIPIFLMPIAVVDSVHVLSEFKDNFQRFGNVQQTLHHVMAELYRPMLLTSLTSAVGFGSLALTPIPPVRVFGIFVCLGVLVAFLLTLTLLPAYLVRLDAIRLSQLLTTDTQEDKGMLANSLRKLGHVAHRKRWLLIALCAGLTSVAAIGLTRLRINDNPVRWFTKEHPIFVADRILNDHFAGTYRTYLVLDGGKEEPMFERLESKARPTLERSSKQVRELFDELKRKYDSENIEASNDMVVRRLAVALDTASLEDFDELEQLLSLAEAEELHHKVFYEPDVLTYLETLQKALTDSGLIGKASSIVDVVKTVHRELRGGSPEQFRIPDSPAAVGEVLFNYQSSHRPDDLWHLMTKDARHAVVWLQHPSGDNMDVSAVATFVERYVERNPPPRGLRTNWAGLPYVNVVWQQKMVRGMLDALGSSFLVVLVMMVVLFRSVRFGLLAMLPLSFTLIVIYGTLGWIGKDYDMPVAVLSSLALGLSVDFAIHFLERAKKIQASGVSRDAVVAQLFEEPARAILRNLLVIAVGFTPLLAAPLVPYVTVGLLMAAIMVLSGLATLVLLPASLGALPGFSRNRATVVAPSLFATQPTGANK